MHSLAHHWMGVSGQLHAASALCLGEEALLHIG